MDSGVTYGPQYVATQRELQHASPFQQARRLVPVISARVAGSHREFFLSFLVSDELRDLVAPDYGTSNGLTAKIQRQVSSALARAFDRSAGPIEAIAGFALLGLVGRLLLRRARGWTGGIASLAFAICYAILSVPVAYGIIALLGYRSEDRAEYRFDRHALDWLYRADLWRPLSDWRIAAAVGIALFAIRIVETVPTVTVMVYAKELEDTPFGRSNPVLMLIAQEESDTLAKELLKSVAMPLVLIWAAQSFVPSMITLLLVVPAVLRLPWSIAVAARAVRLGRSLRPVPAGDPA